jgi:hypothetical protein
MPLISSKNSPRMSFSRLPLTGINLFQWLARPKYWMKRSKRRKEANRAGRPIIYLVYRELMVMEIEAVEMESL